MSKCLILYTLKPFSYDFTNINIGHLSPYTAIYVQYVCPMSHRKKCLKYYF